MKPPTGIIPLETSLSVLWFEDDLFCSVMKPQAVLNRSSLSVVHEYAVKHGNGNKLCFLADISNTAPPSKEVRDYFSDVMSKHIRVLALITNSFMSRTIAEVFLLVRKPPFAIQLFSNADEARKWVSSLCKSSSQNT